ncbi:MAG TPA: DUF6178 family protein [Myxococcota bacterium]|nr:DUF6178 family protein [Myxococcota bacterium]
MNGYLNNIENQLSNIHQLPAKKRLDLIINHPSPIKLLRSMPTADLLLTLRELGAESSLELVEMLHPRQVQELLDLEIWSQDRLNARAAGFYFSLLFAANRDTAISQIHGLDIELIGLMFKLVTKIYDLTCNEEPEDYPDLYSLSPDGRFIVCFSEKEGDAGLAQSLHTLLLELYHRDMPFALRLLESLRFELASGLEEASLRFRNSRLLDLGILPTDERLIYFSTVSPSEIRHALAQSPKPLGQPENTLPIKAVNQKIDERYPYLLKALAQVSPERVERLWYEVNHAFVNMYASLSGDFGDREHMNQVGDYVKFLLDLGLLQHCQGQKEMAAESLNKASGKLLIRFGRTTLVNLRKRLIEKTKDINYIFGSDFCHGDLPLREVAQALSLAEPRFYEGLTDAKKLTVRYFLRLNDLNATINAVNELIFRAELVGKNGVGFTSDALKAHSHLSHASILARSLVNRFRGETDLLASISENVIKEIFSDQGRLKKEFVKTANSFMQAWSLTRLPQHNAQEIEEKNRHFLSSVLIQLEQNWRLVIG